MFLKTSKHLYLIVFAALLLFFNACDEGIFESGLNEGMIEYKISYPSIAEDSYMQDFLPKKAETYFAKGEFRTDVIAAMGLFKTSIINQKEYDGLVHSIKILNKKVASELEHKDIVALNPEFKNISIKETKGKKMIAGYNCNEVEVTVESDSSWAFKLYYTNEINIKNANKMSPFSDLDGVLMEYHVLSRGIQMKFTANKVVKKEISRDQIVLADDYEIVSPSKLKEEMDAIFNQLH